jgi:virginiamycin B lyase
VFKPARLAVLATLAWGLALPAAGQDWTARLPDGAGKETVAAVCGACHEFFSRAGAGYTPEGWRTVLRMMVNVGAPIPPGQLESLTAYLIRNFPEKPKPPGRMIAGPARISIQTWTVPTPGSRPHDPLATRDGALWYTGQMANVLGRLDPRTGTFAEYPLLTPHGGPHGLAEDA